MGKKLTLIIFTISIISGFSQSRMKYSGFFDSYYRTGPVKYFVEPGITMMFGDLGKNKLSAGFGAGVNYRILPPIYVNSSLRYMSLSSSDHVDVRGLSHSNNAFQLNAIGNYHFVYDRIRTNRDRRRGQKFLNTYVSTGLSFMLYHNVKPNPTGFVVNTISAEEKVNITQITKSFSKVVQIPLGLGMPIRVSNRFTITPEVMWYFSLSDRIDGIEYTLSSGNDSYLFANIKLMFNPKGKRKKPKKIKATNSESGTGGSNGDDFDNFDSGFDDSPSEEINETPEQEESEEIEEEIIEETEDDEFIEDESPEENENEDEGPKYDEDGFLIDE